MTHDEAFLLMMDTLDQVAGPADRHRLEEHLLNCAECTAEWQSLQVVEGLFLSVPIVPAPAGFSAQVMDRLERPSWARTLGALFALGVGSIVALLVVGVPALLLLLVFSTVYTDPGQFTNWVVWLRDLISVGGPLMEGLATTLRLVFARIAGHPVALGWAVAAALAVGLWAHLMLRFEPASLTANLDE